MASSIQEQFLAIAAAQWARTEGRQSWLLQYLPAVYAGDDFMKRFLHIFEDTLRPLQLMIENFSYYFDPLMAPPEVVEWLATWVNLVLDESWPLEERRRLVHSASDLYSRRGTRRGLIEYLRLYTGVEADVSEYEDGMTLGPETRLGVNTVIAGREGFSFTVTMLLEGLNEEELVYQEATIRRIIETEKPAHTAYRLRLITDKKTYIQKVTPQARVVGDGLATAEHKGNGDGPVVRPDGITKMVKDDGQIATKAAPSQDKDKKAHEQETPGPTTNSGE